MVITDRRIIGQTTAKATQMMDSSATVGMKKLIEKVKKRTESQTETAPKPPFD